MQDSCERTSYKVFYKSSIEYFSMEKQVGAYHFALAYDHWNVDGSYFIDLSVGP